jgi:circadian clock protein KaiC
MMKKIPTGVPGLDVVLGGGLDPGSATVLAGAPGTGKTTLAQQICFAAAAAGHRSVYYTTVSEPHSKLVRHLEAFGFFDPRALGPRVEHIHLGDFIRDDRPGRMEPMVEEIVRKTMDEQPAIVVIDSAKALRDFTGERELRMEFYDLTSRLAHTGAALLLIGEYTSKEMSRGVEFSLADGIIQLAYKPRQPIDRRWVRIRKMRGSRHLEGKHTFRIPAVSRCSPGSRPSTPAPPPRSPAGSTAGYPAWTT